MSSILRRIHKRLRTAAVAASLIVIPPETPTPGPGPTPTPTPAPTQYGRFGFIGDRTGMIAGATAQRATVVSKIDAEEWRPWNADGTYTITGSDQLAAGISTQAILNDVRDKIYGLMDSAPNLLHRIRIPAGVYEANFQDKEFGFGRRPVFGPTGGVILTSDTGNAEDVKILGSSDVGGGFSAACDGMILYKLTFARAANGPSAGGADANLYLEGTTTTNGGRFVIDSCNFGAYWHPTNSGFASTTTWSRAIQCNWARQLTVRKCNFRRCSYQQYVMNARIYHSYDNLYQEVIQVQHYIHCQSDNDTTGEKKGIFADDNTYYYIHQEICMGAPDAVAIIGTPHMDFVQLCRKQNNFNQAVPKTNPGDMKLWVEDCILWTDVSGSAEENGQPGIVPSTHIFIDSDTTGSDPYPRPNTEFGFDNIILTGTGFVGQYSKGTKNCFSRISATSAPQIAADWNVGSQRQASGNILHYVTATGGEQILDKLIIRNIDYSTASPPPDSAFVDDNGENLGSNQPQDFFEGTFIQSSGNVMWIFSLPNALTLAPHDFAEALINQFKPKAGVAGGTRFLLAA